MSKSKVLIIDDDHHISAGAQLRLSSAGFDTMVAYDGAEGVATAHDQHPDAIVLDVQMPGMDGLTALERLKEDPTTRDIPVIMLSASILDQNTALEIGARYFIRKPFSGPALIEAVTAAMDPK